MQLKTDKSLVSDSKIMESTEKLSDYISHLREVAQNGGYEADEASINIPFDEDILAAVEEMGGEKIGSTLKYIVVIGIGGSNLGTKAMYDAVYGHTDVLNHGRFPKILFSDTNNEAFLKALGVLIEKDISLPEEILFVSISKSGRTAETIANTEIIFDVVQKKFGNDAARERLVIISDEGSPLSQAAQEKGIALLPIPQKVGGRYSVFSAAGLFPLLAVGIDIRALLEGAREMREKCLEEGLENYAFVSATVLFESYKNKKTINDNFIFHSELESLGKWYRQLMGESIGKEKDKEGTIVNVGITPTVSIGSTDLHSVGQLYLGGPKDKITTFIYSDVLEGIAIPDARLFPGLVKMIESKSTADIVVAILKGVKIAYEKRQLPFMEVIIDDITPRSIGAFMQFKMIEMMYLGTLLNINPFDQPNVESYKIETKNILEE